MDPNEPSFLTTLPPEIRNRIFGFLFEQDDPILLHDGKAYRKHLLEVLKENIKQSHFSDHSNDDDDADAQGSQLSKQVAQQIDIEQHVKDEEFQHNFGEVIKLLLSCRQVYHEAVG
jgi:hypothetical protein